MSMLLSIRGTDYIRRGVAAANEFLAYRRRCSPQAQAVDEVLGIRLRSELDGDLAAYGVLVRESFSVSGLWSLCWMDDAFIRTAKTARLRRRQLVDALVKGDALQPRAFLPVFDASGTIEAAKAMLRELRAEYPEVVSTTWFLDDGKQGLIDSRRAR